MWAHGVSGVETIRKWYWLGTNFSRSKYMANLRKVYIVVTLLSISFFHLKAQYLNTQKLDSLFDRLEDNNQAMGTFSVAKHGKALYSRSLGYSFISEDKKIKNDSNTQYQIGSISKTFTATMIFQLIDEGKLTLETKLSQFFPKIPGAEEIKISTLLSHRSGLFDIVNDISDKAFLTKPQKRAKILSYIQYGQLHFKPNTDQLYSNSSYFLLALIIEKITKSKYNTELQERVCKILNLNRTFSPTTKKMGDSKSYYYKDKWNMIADLYPTNITGVGDIMSTPSDLICFIEGLLNNKLVSNQSLKSMKGSDEDLIGMGLMKVPFGSKMGYGHGGDTYGTHSLVVTFERDSLTLAFCDNGENYPHNDIVIDILNIYFDKRYNLPDFNFYPYETKDLDRYAGRYTSKETPLELTISQQSNKLIAQAAGQSSFPLKSNIKDKFYFREAKLEIEFQVEKGEMLLKQHGKAYIFQKIKKE